MLIIGLTGGIGSGKSTVAEYFAKLGVDVIDTDQIAREVVTPNSNALIRIIQRFGNDILTSQGELNRKKLGTIVFNDPLQRQWLEQLLHPLIRQTMLQRIKQATSPYCVVVIPLLLETKSKTYAILDRILIIDASEEQQIAHVQQRDQLSAEQIRAILKAQVNREERLAAADDIIYNDQNLDYLQQQVLQLHQRYLELAK